MSADTYANPYPPERFPYQTVSTVSATQARISVGIDENDSSDFLPMGPEDLVAYCARVSNPSNQSNRETGPKLVKYLMKNKHWSPLEMVDVTLEINTTRDVARQILRHRSFSFQEFSQRYADASQLGLITTKEARLQDTTNRQNSHVNGIDPVLEEWWRDIQDVLAKSATDIYEMALKHGMAKEVARAILPEGMTMSRVLMKGSLRSWLHYVELRTANGTQAEHMDVAEKCRVQLEQVCQTFFAKPEVPNLEDVRPGA